MRYLSFLFLLFTAAAVGFAANDESDEQSVQYNQKRQFNVAQKTQSDGLYENALTLWNEFLKKYPQSDYTLEVKYNRGLCFYQLNKYKEAKQDLDEVLNSDKKIAKKEEALLFCGLSAQRLSENNPDLAQEAKKHLETFLKEFPNSENAIYAKFNLAKLYEQLNSPDLAKNLYIEIWQKYPRSEFAPEAYLQMCYIMFDQKMYTHCARAAMGFSTRWKKQPELFNAQVLAGDALYVSGNYKQAENQYAVAIAPAAKEPDKFDKLDYAIYNRGICQLLLHEYDKAAEQFSNVITQFPKSTYVPAATLACGDAYWKSNNVQKAKEFLLKASEIEECTSKANLILAEIYFKENDIEQATKRIDAIQESLFKCRPTESEAQQSAARQACVLRVNILSRSDDPKRLQTCVKLCDQIALQWQDNPSAPWATFLAARVEFKLQHYDNAVNLCHQIQKNWKKSPQNLDSQILEANCLIKNKKFKEAGNLYYNLYTNNPNDDRRYEWLIITCKMLDMHHQFEQISKLLPKEIPNIKPDELLPDALYLCGKAACELNRLDEALIYLNSCQEKCPNYPAMDKVLFVQGMVYIKQNNNGKSLETFQKILDNYPDSSVKQGAIYYITQLYSIMGDFKAALDQADKIIAQDVKSPYRPGAILDSMYILIKNDMWEQGLKRGDLFIKDYPQHDSVTKAYQYRALCKYHLKKFTDTTEDCRQGLDIAKQKNQLDKYELPLRQLEVSSLAQQDNKIEETQKAFDAFMEAKQRLGKTVSNEDSVVYLYANALYNANNVIEACKQYKYLFENFKSSPYRFESAFALGQEAANYKRYEKAKEYLSFAVDGSDSAAAIKSAHKLGWIFYNEKSYEEARKNFNRAIEIYESIKDTPLPDVADLILDSRVMSADCLYWQKKYPEALALYKDLPDLPVQFRAATTVRAAQCAIEIGDLNLAANLLDKILDNNNSIVQELAQTSKKWEPALQHLRAKIWMNSDKKDQAEKLFEQIVKQNSDVNPANVPETTFRAIAESWIYLGELLFLKGNFRDAIPNYYNVIFGFEDFPDLQADACYEAARCFESLKQVNQARKMYQKILDEYPRSSKAQSARSKLGQLKKNKP